VSVAGIARLRLQERLAGAALVAAQHVRVAAIVEDLRRRSGDLRRLIVGAVGKVEPALPVVGGRQPDPGLDVARMQLHRAAEVALGQPEIAGAEIFLAEADIVIRIGRWWCRGDRYSLARLWRQAAGDRRIVLGPALRGR